MNSDKTKDGISQAYNSSVKDITDQSWDDFLKSLEQFSDDFMNDRNQPEHQQR